MTHDELQTTLADHKEWLKGNTKGKRANLRFANLSYANLRFAILRNASLRNANLRYANLRDANLRDANLRSADLRYADLRYADLRDADLRDADLRYADLRNANLRNANLRSADLRDADLRNANLLCMGNHKELKTVQLEKWNVGYTYDTLQIGCQRHAIDKWMKWNTEAGRKWINLMDCDALEWADKFLPIVLDLIKVSPATKKS